MVSCVFLWLLAIAALAIYNLTLAHVLQGQRVLISFEGIQGPRFFSFVTMLHKEFFLHSSLSMQVKDDSHFILLYHIIFTCLWPFFF